MTILAIYKCPRCQSWPKVRTEWKDMEAAIAYFEGWHPHNEAYVHRCSDEHKWERNVVGLCNEVIAFEEVKDD